MRSAAHDVNGFVSVDGVRRGLRATLGELEMSGRHSDTETGTDTPLRHFRVPSLMTHRVSLVLIEVSAGRGCRPMHADTLHPLHHVHVGVVLEDVFE